MERVAGLPAPTLRFQGGSIRYTRLATLFARFGLTVASALAQATTPPPGTATTPGAGAATGGGGFAMWWYIIFLILAVAAVIWFVRRGRGGRV